MKLKIFVVVLTCVSLANDSTVFADGYGGGVGRGPKIGSTGSSSRGPTGGVGVSEKHQTGTPGKRQENPQQSKRDISNGGHRPGGPDGLGPSGLGPNNVPKVGGKSGGENHRGPKHAKEKGVNGAKSIKSSDWASRAEWPWQQVHRVSIATATMNMAYNTDEPHAKNGETIVEAVTKDQLTLGSSGRSAMESRRRTFTGICWSQTPYFPCQTLLPQKCGLLSDLLAARSPSKARGSER